MINVYQWHCHIQLSLVATTVAAWLAVDVLLQIIIFTLQMLTNFLMVMLYFDDNNTQMQPESPGRPSIFPPQLQSPKMHYHLIHALHIFVLLLFSLLLTWSSSSSTTFWSFLQTWGATPRTLHISLSSSLPVSWNLIQIDSNNGSNDGWEDCNTSSALIVEIMSP